MLFGSHSVYSYYCSACNYHFMLTTPDGLASLPRHVLTYFPFLLTHRSGVHRDIVRLLPAMIDSGAGPSGVFHLIREIYTSQYQLLQRTYYDAVLTFGVCPCVPASEYDNVTDDSVKMYAPSYKFLARRMRTIVPHLPVATVPERQLFNKTVNFYLGAIQSESAKSANNIDFSQFAMDWNNGNLRGVHHGASKPDVQNQIFQKLSLHLESYFKV